MKIVTAEEMREVERCAATQVPHWWEELNRDAIAGDLLLALPLATKRLKEATCC
jgi:hypothetical protein